MSTVQTGSSPSPAPEAAALAQPSQVKETIERRMLAALLVVLVISIIVLGAAVLNTINTSDASILVNRTHEVILNVDGIQSSLNAAEANLRQYILSGEETEAAACRTHLGEVDEFLQVVQSQVGSEPDVPQKAGLTDAMKKLNGAVNLESQAIQAGLLARKVSKSPEAAQVEIRSLVAAIKNGEDGILHQRDQAARAYARTTRWIIFSGVGLNAVLLMIGLVLVRRDLAVRRAYAAFLENTNDILEQKVRERTAELAKANESLTIENLERQWSHAALERLCRHNEMVIQSLGEGVCVISQLGNMLQLNPTAAFEAGYKSTQELVGRPLRTILRQSPQGDEPAWAHTPIGKAMAAGEALDRVAGLRLHKDGQLNAVRFTCRPLMDNGKVVGAVVAIVD